MIVYKSTMLLIRVHELSHKNRLITQSLVLRTFYCKDNSILQICVIKHQNSMKIVF